MSKRYLLAADPLERFQPKFDSSLRMTEELLKRGIAVDYLDDNAPCVEVRMQEVFGLADTPRIGGGKVPITLKLLSPACRPMQITRDLSGFWRGSYAEVRKDMRGRYPRHYWPENPLEAEPVRGLRPRRS